MTRTRAAAGIAASVAGVGLAAATRPFTAAADVLVAVGIAALVVFAALQRSHARVPDVISRRPSGSPATDETRWAFWIVALLLVGGWEGFCYASAPRHAHPTLSSMAAAFTAYPAGRGAAFLGWLAAGWYLVTR